MILTDREIRLSIENGLITVTPRPLPKAISSTSLDLMLDERFTSFNTQPRTQPSGLHTVIDPAGTGYNFDQTQSHICLSNVIHIDQGYDLPPRQLILGWTKERIELKPLARIAARVEGKSSLARLGLAVHVTAPTIHAGFAGQIQLEIINHGSSLIKLRVGMAICQIIFEQTLGFPEAGYSGHFAGQGGR